MYGRYHFIDKTIHACKQWVSLSLRQSFLHHDFSLILSLSLSIFDFFYSILLHLQQPNLKTSHHHFCLSNFLFFLPKAWSDIYKSGILLFLLFRNKNTKNWFRFSFCARVTTAAADWNDCSWPNKASSLVRTKSSTIETIRFFNPGLFLFSVFSNKQYNFTTNICEKCPSSIRCRDSNPRPSEHESLPITTRPGLSTIRLLSGQSLITTLEAF